ncbi:DNA-directed DNA polymerase [Clostridia bacterium]|nr:DNA-directed DNA polymerase [Clostridia bacterium]
MGFTHLHVHSEFSVLDGLTGVKDLVKAAQGLGMTSLALTDHGNMFGVIDFYNAAVIRDEEKRVIFDSDGLPQFKLKPIIGCEAYTAARTRFDRDKDFDRQLGHLVLLVENEIGYRNLTKIVSDANVNTYYKPRTDLEMLRAHAEGLIALSACLAGDIPRKLLQDDYEGAKALALEFQSIYGVGRFYLEIQDQGLPEEAQIRESLIRLSRETGIPLVATNDIHYISKEDAKAHDILLCVQTGSKIDDPDRMRFTGDGFYMRSEEEMRELFKDIPEAIDNTEKIAQMCDFHFDLKSTVAPGADDSAGKRYFPVFEHDTEKDNRKLLRQLCEDGLDYRYGADKEAHRERLEYELSVIESMGFTDYFLIVWDFIRYAREHGIAVGPGRGSAAGSLVSYALRITNIDPIRYGLLFERFLNPERVSMPDIDIDFCIDRREEVIEYVREKYGRDKVSQIITFGTMQAKAAIKDVGRVLDIPFDDVNKVVKMLPPKAKNLSEALSGESKDNDGSIIYFHKESEAFCQMFEGDKDHKKDTRLASMIRYAQILEGKVRHPGTHAAGVVICRGPLIDCVPLYQNKDKSMSVQFTMGTVEDLGLLKMDFLGLRNLTLIANTERMIEGSQGGKVDVSALSYDDPKVFALIGSGATEGVFQLEGGGMQGFMRQLAPTSFEDIIVGISMYRPGPMNDIPDFLKNRKNPDHIRYIHSALEPILAVTSGVMVYQEQVMQIFRDLAGYTYGGSDSVRRAMSKKKEDALKRERTNFVAGCREREIPESAANKIFDQMISFASYAFNKSHAAVYAVLAYQTAWLKTYYPAEFMAALMSSVSDDMEKMTKYILSARDMGIKVIPPDVLKAQKEFSVVDGAIVMGLQAVKNVGGSAIDEIIAARGRREIRSLEDFVAELATGVAIENADGITFNAGKVNQRAAESLILAGAFDVFGKNRAKLIQDYIMLAERYGRKSKTMPGQTSLFDLRSDTDEEGSEDSAIIDTVDFPPDVRMEKEKEMLGLYFTEHPLDQVKGLIWKVANTTTYQIKHPEEYGSDSGGQGGSDKQAILIGIMRGIREVTVTKGRHKNHAMAIFSLEDHFGVVDVVVFSEVYEKCRGAIRDLEVERDSGLSGTIFKEGAIAVVRGKVAREEGRNPSIYAVKVTPIEAVAEFYRKQGEKMETEKPNE